MTEYLEPSAYGELSLGLTIATLVNQTLYGPLGNGISRFFSPAFEDNSLHSYFRTSSRLVFLVTLLVGCISSLVLMVVLFLQYFQWFWIILGSLILSISMGINSILSGIQGAARQRAVVAIHQGVDVWVRFLVATLLLIWIAPTSNVAILGYGISSGIVIISQIFFFWIFVKKGIESNQCKERNWKGSIWKYSWPFIIIGIFNWLRLVSDRWALETFATTSEVGFYAVVFQLGYYPMTLLSGIFIQYLAPIFYQKAGDGTNEKRNSNVNGMTNQLTIFFLVVTLISFILAMFFNKEIFWILVAKEYWSVSYLLPWMLLSGGLFAASHSLALSMMSKMKTNSLSVITSVTSILGSLLNFIGAYLWGIDGVVMGGMAYSFFLFIWMIIFHKNQLKMPD